MKKFEEMQEIISSPNTQPLRSNNFNPPYIPYLAMYLKDLMIYDSMPKKLDSGLINWKRVRSIVSTIKKILDSQHQHYSLERIPWIQYKLDEDLSMVLDYNSLYDCVSYLTDDKKERPEVLARFLQKKQEERSISSDEESSKSVRSIRLQVVWGEEKKIITASPETIEELKGIIIDAFKISHDVTIQCWSNFYQQYMSARTIHDIKNGTSIRVMNATSPAQKHAIRPPKKDKIAICRAAEMTKEKLSRTISPARRSNSPKTRKRANTIEFPSLPLSFSSNLASRKPVEKCWIFEKLFERLDTDKSGFLTIDQLVEKKSIPNLDKLERVHCEYLFDMFGTKEKRGTVLFLQDFITLLAFVSKLRQAFCDVSGCETDVKTIEIEYSQMRTAFKASAVGWILKEEAKVKKIIGEKGEGKFYTFQDFFKICCTFYFLKKKRKEAIRALKNEFRKEYKQPNVVEFV